MSAKTDHYIGMDVFILHEMKERLKALCRKVCRKEGIYSAYTRNGELYIDPIPNIKPIKLQTYVSKELAERL